MDYHRDQRESSTCLRVLFLRPLWDMRRAWLNVETASLHPLGASGAWIGEGNREFVQKPLKPIASFIAKVPRSSSASVARLRAWWPGPMVIARRRSL